MFKSFLIVCSLTLGLNPIAAFAQITLDSSPQDDNQSRELNSINSSVVERQAPRQDDQKDLLPFAERYRRAALRGSTLNNPALHDLKPLPPERNTLYIPQW